MNAKRFIIVFCSFVLSAVAAHAQTIDVNAAETGHLNHTWSVGTRAGRVNEGLRTSWVEQLRLAKEQCGFEYLRMHDLFNDDMCIYFEQTQHLRDVAWATTKQVVKADAKGNLILKLELQPWSVVLIKEL